MVTRWMPQGLQHRFAGTGVRVVLVKPGPTDTPMNGTQGPGRQAGTGGKRWRNISWMASQQVPVYALGKWWLIMMVILWHLPSFIFNKMNI